MRVLLDECVDWRFARDLVAHDVKTARQMGWTAIQNGELLKLASKHFDVFVTVDRNLSFQQKLGDIELAVVVIHAKTNRLAHIKDLLAKILVAIGSARKGTVTIVGP
ncbi:MAG: DUF5615 family PIN-like protein [Alphaproteobacteria bacterium]|nr:DUF5615 family PIN-like protein [Alphaproteobacteria bacterium]